MMGVRLLSGIRGSRGLIGRVSTFLISTDFGFVTPNKKVQVLASFPLPEISISDPRCTMKSMTDPQISINRLHLIDLI